MTRLMRITSLGLVCGLWSCRPEPGPQHGTGAAGDVVPTPAPPFGSIDQASLDDVLGYARSLTYESNTGYSDRQALAVSKVPGGRCPGQCEYGPVARIEPEPGTVALTDSALKAGRIVGRIINEGGPAYEKLNLGPNDTVYVWIDGTAGTLRARTISTDPRRAGKSKRDLPVSTDGDHGKRYTRGTARWMWSELDEDAWYTCAQGCCVVKGQP